MQISEVDSYKTLQVAPFQRQHHGINMMSEGVNIIIGDENIRDLTIDGE